MPVGAPWLPPPDGWGIYAIDRQDADPSSMLALYRRLVAARRSLLGTSDAELLDEHDDLVALRRGEVIVACNMGRSPVPCRTAAGFHAALTTGADPDGATIPADTTAWFTP